MTQTTRDLFQHIIDQETTAKAFGFYWESLEQLLQQIRDEANEIDAAAKTTNKAHLQEEIGDLMNAVVSLCIFCGFNPTETLSANIEKFQRRYDAVVQLVKQDGLTNLQGEPMAILMDYWNKAKKA